MRYGSLETAVRIARAAAREGGRTFFVGGYVRDKLRRLESKDVDIEVHGISPLRLEHILDSIGERISVGESFGIYMLKGCPLDIAMPRREENRGRGHRDFDVFTDPFIGTYKAALRRDFTINSLMEDVLTGELIDHFGGVRDIENGVIRHVDDTAFAEDPLRVLRAAQFASRFGYTVAPETVGLCRRMDLSSLPAERIMGETSKALLSSDKPSVFFETLREMDQLSVWFPELEQTASVPQDPKRHAEGDVWTHTMMVVDKAAEYRDKAENPLGFMLAAAAHDFGKALCTQYADGRVRAYAHESVGLPLVKAFIKRLTAEKALISYAANLCELHMKPFAMFADSAPVKSTNRLFDSSVDPEALIYLALSDGLGKLPPIQADPFIGFFTERLAVFKEYMSRP
ncbi:MAG: tRNA nucleotidyltransferase, partial [Oscillospiraceae bacterium]|nr:tRNA nucleotidyltransferase [Oscillospiraceae bacterium]